MMVKGVTIIYRILFLSHFCFFFSKFSLILNLFEIILYANYTDLSSSILNMWNLITWLGICMI